MQDIKYGMAVVVTSCILHPASCILHPASCTTHLLPRRLSFAALPASRMLARDDRRRRLLNEEIAGAAAREGETAAGSSRAAGRRKARYARAADMAHQPRITDLIPRRKLTLGLWCLLGVATIAALEALYWWMPRVAKMTRDGRVAAFDLDGEGSLGAWFTAMLLAATGLAAVLIYSLRRHRLDDYRGRYRLWLWAAAAFFIMSIDEAGSLHEGFKEMMYYLTAERLYGDGSVWWVMAYGAVFGLLGLFIVWDARESWLAELSFLATAGFYAVAVATQLGLLLPNRGARAVMLEEGCEMLGAITLLLGMVTYARHIILQIECAPARRKRKVKRGARAVKGTAAVAVTSSPPIAARIEQRPGGQLPKDPPHTAPPAAVAINKPKAPSKGH